ncbi:PHP domain-containing protein [Fervidobacterium thailandense]|uniref:PHP domain-containing protein n=1 Tax=Fervidobacterium thailandense TaxID=1008305 RepID=UPI000B1DF172|nr:PHP domain-containing protein [Fervidobacterium thailandense]
MRFRIIEDYHIHSNFSPDSNSTVEEIIQVAREKGIGHIIITDHFELADQHANEIDVETYRKVMERYSLPVGVELGWDGIKELNVDTSKFDYVLLSHHFVEEPITQESYKNYLLRILDIMERFDGYHALAHLDFPRRYHPSKEPFSLELFDIIAEILNKVIRNGKILEVNMSSFKLYNEPNPSLEILKLYRSLGGRNIVIGSDAHDAQHVGRYVLEGIEMLKSIGYNYILVFDMEWREVKI